MLDLDAREIAIFVPLILLVLWMGIYPKAYFDVMAASVSNLILQVTP
jgi:NADH-quinone oxidoreductase subunit M